MKNSSKKASIGSVSNSTGGAPNVATKLNATDGSTRKTGSNGRSGRSKPKLRELRTLRPGQKFLSDLTEFQLLSHQPSGSMVREKTQDEAGKFSYKSPVIISSGAEVEPLGSN